MLLHIRILQWMVIIIPLQLSCSIAVFFLSYPLVSFRPVGPLFLRFSACVTGIYLIFICFLCSERRSSSLSLCLSGTRIYLVYIWSISGFLIFISLLNLCISRDSNARHLDDRFGEAVAVRCAMRLRRRTKLIYAFAYKQSADRNVGHL